MSVIPSLAAGLAQLQALANFLDTGSTNATFIFYDDAKPSSVNVAANASAKLVTLTFPKPCFKKLNTDGIELNQTDAALVIKAGTATWARIYNGKGEAVADFAVGTEITLAQPNLALGSTLMINSFVLKPIT
ncbi:hypothetical protein F895_02590 [Acinetobacter sp. CIP 64.2]|uniref:hypothetical protein n=1 Tax=Acinetobacter sp. CIP 64.2 TaxID=1217694 RepID=UPI000287A7EA|nr:hypothetical protein [Acinetobacter sp. CIP 64.2]ENX13286.1 hypothetical protein F895_02590 [Acinetobacter sp. CIP 64.2]